MPLQCDIKNPLKRDGTSQERRELDALAPDNAPIDERTREDLLTFAHSYAELVQFYDADNNLVGNWQTFFAEDIDSDEPHMALFCTFLELFAKAQEHLNELTADHLDFYYKEVLQIEKKAAEPDKAHIVFELAKNVTTHKLEIDTALSAGKDDSKAEIIFTTDKEIVVNITTAEDFKTVYVAKLTDALTSTDYISAVFAAPEANSKDGEGTEFEEESDSWPPFGATQYKTATDGTVSRVVPANRTMTEGDVGFAVASPLLRMAEGKRTVKVKVEVATAIDASTSVQIADGLECHLTGEEGWFEPSSFALNTTLTTTTLLVFDVELTSSEAAVVDYNEEVFAEGYETEWPMIKLLCSPLADDYALKFLATTVVRRITLLQDVSEYRSLVLQNGAALLDPSAPFMPFGPQPSIGSRLLIGSEEVFRKRLQNAELHIDWHELPQGDLQDHYANYAASGIPANSGYKVQPYILLEKTWYETGPDRRLLRDDAEDHKKLVVTLEDDYLKDTGDPLVTYTRSFNTQEITEYNHTIKDGFIALELIAPTTPFRAFGHREYPRALTMASIAAATGETGAGTEDIPNAPYTPTIKELSLTYSSRTTFRFGEDGPATNNPIAYKNRVEQFFHVRPFGNEEQHPWITKDEDIYLMPQFEGEGILYIGLENLDPGQNISLLFQVAEGTADPNATKETIEWSYLRNKGWKAFTTGEVLSDSTNELLTSGIVTFAAPKTMVDDNPYLPQGKFWIRGVTGNAEAHAEVISVHAQAVAVTFEDNGNDLSRLASALEASSIKKLATAQSQIKKVEQPYASFDGRTKEEDDDYYTRVSERLRHKQRAITIWDYEHLVLQQFPSVYKVKCINHTSKTSEYAPGQVSLVVVSNLRNKNAVNPLEPLTSVNTLDEIQTYVDELSTTFVTPIVRNPEFEQVRVRFKVWFYETVDEGTYLKQLPEDINTFLSPWAYEDGKDIVFQGRIHKSMILNFVEELDYVDYVSCFEMDHVTATDTYTNVEEAQATHAAAILVADEQEFHDITVMQPGEDCDCSSGGAVTGAEGLDFWAIEEDFVVS